MNERKLKGQYFDGTDVSIDGFLNQDTIKDTDRKRGDGLQPAAHAIHIGYLSVATSVQQHYHTTSTILQ